MELLKTIIINLIVALSIFLIVLGCSGFIYKKPNAFYSHDKHVDILFKEKKIVFIVMIYQN